MRFPLPRFPLTWILAYVPISGENYVILGWVANTETWFWLQTIRQTYYSSYKLIQNVFYVV